MRWLSGRRRPAEAGCTCKGTVSSNMYEVYIIKSITTGRYYIGQTNNLDDRIRRHNSGYEISTKTGIPWKLIHREEFASRAESMRRELEIKGYKGNKKFKELIAL